MAGRPGRSGKRPIPDEVKKARGTFRPDRDTKAKFEYPAGKPRPEKALLNEHGMKKYKEVLGYLSSVEGLLSKADGDALMLYALAYQDIVMAQADIDKWGLLTTNGGTSKAVDVKKKATETMMKLMGRFGFTPADRQALHTEKAGNDEPSELMKAIQNKPTFQVVSDGAG